MTQGEGRENGEAKLARAGEHVLALLATPLNYAIIRALAERPRRLSELRRATGLPAQTTLRGHLADLEALGFVAKRLAAGMPAVPKHELTAAGRELLAVSVALEAWLALAPARSISLEGGTARGVIKALADGWSSGMLDQLAAQPLSLTQLDRQIVPLSYPALERRLSSMRMADLVEARPSGPNGTPYAITAWARLAISPVVAASHCERQHLLGRPVPMTKGDIQAAFMMATPLVRLLDAPSGTCQLRVEEEDGDVDVTGAGVQVTVDHGRVVACSPELREAGGAFAAGSEESWLGAIRDDTAGRLRFGGGRLGKGLVAGLQAALALTR